MLEETQEINIYRGDTPTVQIQILTEDGDPYDLTGTNVYFAGKSNLHAPEFLFNILCTNTNAIEGCCEAQLDLADTQKVIKEDGMAEIEIRKGASILTIKQFPLFILQDIRNI